MNPAESVGFPVTDWRELQGKLDRSIFFIVTPRGQLKYSSCPILFDIFHESTVDQLLGSDCGSAMNEFTVGVAASAIFAKIKERKIMPSKIPVRPLPRAIEKSVMRIAWHGNALWCVNHGRLSIYLSQNAVSSSDAR